MQKAANTGVHTTLVLRQILAAKLVGRRTRHCTVRFSGQGPALVAACQLPTTCALITCVSVCSSMLTPAGTITRRWLSSARVM
jgi:hypothetical protein